MLGRFLEISIHAPDMLESVSFYDRLGLTQAVTGDVWSHAYGVVTDGHMAIGLHAYEFPSPALVWVRPQLAAFARELESRGITLDFLKTGDDQFNELGFVDPDGQMITLLEARTYSPPSTPLARPAAGFFHEYRYPVRQLDQAVTFWDAMGFVATASNDTAPGPATALTSDGIDLCVYESSRRELPVLVFSTADLDRSLSSLVQRGLDPKPQQDEILALPCLSLRAPEGTHIRIIQDPD